MGHMESALIEPAPAAALNEQWQAGGSFQDLIQTLLKEGHITDDLYVAGCRLVRDMQRSSGCSDGLIARYGAQVDCAKGDGGMLGASYDRDAFRRMETVLRGMRTHERMLFQSLALSRERARGSLADIGRQSSRYGTSKTAKAFAAGQVRSLLQTIHELYRMKILVAS